MSGGIHLDQHAYDRESEMFLRGIGLRVLRFVNLEVEHDLEDVLHAIFRHVSSIRQETNRRAKTCGRGAQFAGRYLLRAEANNITLPG